MDFNDLSLRVKRLYAALGERQTYDLDGAVHVAHDQTSYKVSFGRFSDEGVHNIVFGVIGAIADLKDHLKNKMKAMNKNQQLVENMINDSFELGLMIDLNNLDKHGDPLNKPYRSKTKPSVGPIHQPIKLSTNKVSTTASVQLGTNGALLPQGDVSVELMADILDDKGQKIGDLNEVIDTSVNLIEQFIKTHKI